MGNRLKYLFRRLVREGWLASRRAAALCGRERLSADELQHLQEARLRHSMIAAGNHLPAHADLRGRVPLHGVADFLRANVPILDKEDLLAQRARRYPNGGQPRWWWSVGRTSGSTGTPLEVFRSLDSVVWEQAFHLQHWAWAGYRAGDWQVVLRGDLIVPLDQRTPPYWFTDGVGRQLLVSTRHLHRDAMPSVAQAIRACGASQLRAYPSAASELAQLNEELGLGLRFRAVVTGSEMLYPLQRELIERSFGARVFDFYGMAERNALATECEHGRLHVHPEYALVEIVDAQGRPTDDEGFIVGTTLHNQVMPLLRYRLKDMARWSRAACPCGRNYPVIEALCGKIEERVYDLDGRPVSPSVITFAFKDVAHIERAQIAQVAADRWELRIMPAAGFSDADSQQLLDNMARRVSGRLNVGVRRVEAIDKLPNGKYKWVAQEWQKR
jgi:phenylacetate-CoA ligase